MSFALIDAATPTVGCPAGTRYATSIANVPLIVHVLDELARNGVKEARIVAPPAVSATLARVLANDGRSGIHVSHVPAASTDRRAALNELTQALERGPALLHPGDCLDDDYVARICARFRAGGVDAVLPSEVERRDPDQGHVSEAILLLGSKTRELCADLLATDPPDDLVDALLHSDSRLAVCEQSGGWRYGDSTEELLRANRMILDSLPETSAAVSDDNRSQVHGRVCIDPSAWVSASVLHGPIVIGPRAVVEDSFIGPYTAIASGAILSGVEIDNSMVLEQAEIRHPGTRIEGSIIGERVRLARQFELPRGLHLRLAAGSQVTLS